MEDNSDFILDHTDPPIRVDADVVEKNAELFVKLREARKEKKRIDDEYKTKIAPVNSLLIVYQQIATLFVKANQLEVVAGLNDTPHKEKEVVHDETGSPVKSSIQDGDVLSEVIRDSNIQTEAQTESTTVDSVLEEPNSNLANKFSYQPGDRGALRAAIVFAIKESDDFLSNEDVMRFIEKHLAHFEFDRRTLITGLKDARQASLGNASPDTVVWAQTYGDGARNSYLHGLRSFYLDPANPSVESLMPEYTSKLREAVRRMYNSGIGEEMFGPFISALSANDPKKELAPARTGSNDAKSDTDEGNPSGDAAGNLNGSISHQGLPYSQ